MKNLAARWKEWIESPIGQEALKSADREASMFMAFRIGVIIAEKDIMQIIREEKPQ